MIEQHNKKGYFFWTLFALLYGLFLFSKGLFYGTLLFFLWLSFWILYTPFFLRGKKFAHALYRMTAIKTHYWPILLWLSALFYNGIMLNFYSFLYQENFITSALGLLLTHQRTYWPLMLCCLLKLQYHFLIDFFTPLEHRGWLHHAGNLFILLYAYIFFYWCYADFVVLLTVRN